MKISANIARLHIALADTQPVIWRRIEVPLAISLSDLHDIVQAAMPWEDCHLFHFEIAGRLYGVPDPALDFDNTMLDASEIRLDMVVAEGVTQFVYLYDLGDDWHHEITIEMLASAVPGGKYPRYLEGERRAPPEDVGGADGFDEFVKTISGRGRAKQEAMEWYGGPFDPADVDVDEIKWGLADLAKPVTAGKKPG